MFKFPKKISIEERENKQSLKTMFEKANTSSLAGAPLSWLLNFIITLPVTVWGLSIGLDWLTIVAILWVPFYISSLTRQIVIDYLYAAYKINIDPVF